MKNPKSQSKLKDTLYLVFQMFRQAFHGQRCIVDGKMDINEAGSGAIVQCLVQGFFKCFFGRRIVSVQRPENLAQPVEAPIADIIEGAFENAAFSTVAAIVKDDDDRGQPMARMR